MSDAIQDATSGAMGAVVATLCTYPLDIAKTRLQAQNRNTNADGSPRSPRRSKASAPAMKRELSEQEVRKLVSGPMPYLGTLDCLRRIVKEEGITTLFVGLRPGCISAALTNFVFFYLLQAVRPLFGRIPLLQGMVAGVGLQVTVLPVDMVVTRLQSARGQAAGFGRILRDIVQEQGFFGLWSGLVPGLSLALNPGITQLVLSRLRRDQESFSALKAFWSAAFAKAVATVTTYPLMRAKVQMQVQGMAAGATHCGNTASILMHMVNTNGVMAVFDGLTPQLANQVLKEALLDSVRMKIASLVATVFLLLRRSKAK